MATPQQIRAEHLLLPRDVWASIWGGTGIICLTSAMLSRDRIAFTLAAALKLAWGGISLYGWVSGVLPNGWLSTVVWFSFSATVLIISSWPEPVPIPPVPDPPGTRKISP